MYQSVNNYEVELEIKKHCLNNKTKQKKNQKMRLKTMIFNLTFKFFIYLFRKKKPNGQITKKAPLNGFCFSTFFFLLHSGF